MTNFERAVAIVLEEEGGLVDNPKDPGGLTKYGISQRAYPKLDIRNLTRDDAKAIYLRDYWGHCEALTWPLCLLVFDHSVNAGVGGALRLLQQGAGVPADSAWGPATSAAVAKLEPQKASAAYAVRRIRYYLSLSTAGDFGVGWCGRVARVCLKANQ